MIVDEIDGVSDEDDFISSDGEQDFGEERG